MDDNGVDAIVYPGFLSDVWDNDGAGSHNGSDRATGVLTQGPGLPTSIVPVGFNPHGDPMTMQLMGREWADPQVLGMGYALEQASGPRPQTTTAPALRYVPGATPRPPVIEVPDPPISVPPVQTPPQEAGPTPGPTPGPAPGPTLRPARVAIKAAFAKSATTRGGRIRFVLANRSRARLTGTVTLRVKISRRTIVLGSGKVSIGADKRATLVVRLKRAARRALGRRAKIAATATYRLANPTGARATRATRLTIKLR